MAEAKIPTLIVGNFCDLEPSVKVTWTQKLQSGNRCMCEFSWLIFFHRQLNSHQFLCYRFANDFYCFDNGIQKLTQNCQLKSWKLVLIRHSQWILGFTKENAMAYYISEEIEYFLSMLKHIVFNSRLWHVLMEKFKDFKFGNNKFILANSNTKMITFDRN